MNTPCPGSKNDKYHQAFSISFHDGEEFFWKSEYDPVWSNLLDRFRSETWVSKYVSACRLLFSVCLRLSLFILHEYGV